MTEEEVLLKRQEFGRRLRENRNAYGISIESLSVHSGLSTRTIGQIELGKVAWIVDSEIRYLSSLKELIEALHKRRKTSTRYFPPVVISPEIAIFTKYL